MLEIDEIISICDDNLSGKLFWFEFFTSVKKLAIQAKNCPPQEACCYGCHKKCDDCSFARENWEDEDK